AVGTDAANAVVAKVGDVDGAGGIDGHIERGVQTGISRRAAVAAEAAITEVRLAGHPGEGAITLHPEHDVRIRVGDVEAALRICANAFGRAEARLCRNGAILRGAPVTVPGDVLDYALRGDAPDE